MDKIKLRQICFLFAVMMPITKTIVYPATLAYRSRNDLLWSALCNLLLEGIVIALVMLLAKRTKCTFFDLLQNSFGNTATKIIYGLFALFFFLSALLPLMEQKNFVTLELYENVPPVISFAPFFALCFYACTKGFKTIGRVADIAMPIFAFCFAAILLLAVPHADYAALLPVGDTGAKGIFGGALHGMNWYTDCLYPLFFLGHFEYEKKAMLKTLGAYAAGAFAVLLFLATFYGIYSDIAVLQYNTLAEISKYTTAGTSLGRVDLLFVFALTLVLIFYCCVPVQMCVHCIRKVFGGCSPIIPAAVVNVLLLVFSIFFNYSFVELQTLFTQKLWFVFAIFAYVIPVLSLLLRREPKNKTEEKHE